MTFQKYIESAKPYIDTKDGTYHLLCLVFDTAKLIEKVKYFRNESSLIVYDIGDVYFRIFSLLDKYGLAFDESPFNLEEMKSKVDTLDSLYSIGEDNLLQNYMFEVGVLANVASENM